MFFFEDFFSSKRLRRRWDIGNGGLCLEVIFFDVKIIKLFVENI